MSAAQKAAQKIEELFGLKIEVPVETEQDLVREGQSVLNYFYSRGSDFGTETCKTCEMVFAYCWDVKAVKYCSIPCMQIALQKIGLSWNPTKPPEDRWGRTVPAVVPPAALSILQDQSYILGDLPEDTPL